MFRPLPFAVRHAPALCMLLFFVFALIGALAAPVRGEGLMLHLPGAPDEKTSAPVVAGTADIMVNGIVGRVAIRQTFLNPSEAWVEGVYVFPLPEDAAVDRMRLRVDERLIEARIEERLRAKKVYDAAATSGRRASLLEQERPNFFTMSVANIPPKGRISVEIAYQQRVAQDAGRYSIRFPMAVTPRFISEPKGFTAVDGASAPNDAARLRFPVRSSAAAKTNPMAIRVRLDPGRPLEILESPSHELMVSEPEAGRYDISLAAGAVASDRDFVLEWTLEAPKEPAPFLFVEEKDGAAYVLAMLAAPDGAAEPVAPSGREAIFVIDTSGSMNGEAIRQAREALAFALDRLTPRDRFNIIAFDNHPTRLFDESRPVDRMTLAAARSFVDALTAYGGTEIGAALAMALAAGAEDGHLRQVVLLTDGAVGNDVSLLQQLHHTMGRSRLFTVAIGSAPNGYFMREAARVGRGGMLHISDPRHIRREVSSLFAKLERPALTDVQAAFPQPVATRVLPDPVPDLYHGEPVVLTARVPDARGVLHLSGRIGGRVWRADINLSTARPGVGIAKLWARGMVDRETARLRAGADPDEVRLAVLDLALRHQLLTQYTSLVAVDQERARPADDRLVERRVPANPPAGWSPPNAPPVQKTMMKRNPNRGLELRNTGGKPGPMVSLGVRTATPAAAVAAAGALAVLVGLLLLLLRRRLPA